MPMHDWTKVAAGIYHAFHARWISSLSDALNGGKLPSDYYALAEQVAAGFGPDVLTLQEKAPEPPASEQTNGSGATTMLQARPQTQFVVESSGEVVRRKKNAIVVRHVSGDRIAAMIEIVSPGTCPLTLLVYECDLATRAYIDPIAVGQPLPDMPLYLEPNAYIKVPLEETYNEAFAKMPTRWRAVLEE